MPIIDMSRRRLLQAAGPLQADTPSVTDIAQHTQSKLALVIETIERQRHRFFLWIPVAFAAGIAAYFNLATEPTTLAMMALFATVFLFWCALRRVALLEAVTTALLIAAAGAALIKFRVDHVAAPVLSKSLRTDVTGVVTKSEARVPEGQRLSLRVEEISGLSRERTPRVVRIRTAKGTEPITPGDRIRIKASLTPPSQPSLPGGFDYARTAWFEQIGGVGYALSKPERLGRIETLDWRAQLEGAVEQLRASVSARIVNILPGQTGAIAAALITGERGGIAAETNEIYKDSGLFHILSISGLHMVVMAGAAFYAVRLMLAVIPGAALVLPVKKLAAIAGIVGAVGYLIISGGAFATVRAALMISIMFLAILCDRPALTLRNVALSALVILLVYPESLLDAGFQMSFAAVTGLVAVYEEVRRRRGTQSRSNPVGRIAGFFAGVVASTLIASATVAPFAIYHFHQTQQYAVLANLIAIPICNLIVMPAALLALVVMPLGLEAWPLIPLGWGIDAMTSVAAWVGKLPGAVQKIPSMPQASFALFVTGGLWLMLWQARWRLLGLAPIMAAVAIAPTAPRPDIIVGNNGQLVAVRQADGMLAMISEPKSRFDAERWLEADGDERDVKQAAAGKAFACDADGCAARIDDVMLALPKSPAALHDDCNRADVIVLQIPRPEFCTKPRLVIDLFDFWQSGNHAIYFADAQPTPHANTIAAPEIRVETVTAARGNRPWAQSDQRRDANPKRLQHINLNEAVRVKD